MQISKGFNNSHKQPVIIKVFRIPIKREAQRLAITFWEREI